MLIRYLTADATETVESVDPSTIYVIGGIVDRNRYPGSSEPNPTADCGLYSPMFVDVMSSQRCRCTYVYHFAFAKRVLVI